MAKKGKPRKRKGRIPPPKCKAILLCDQTIVEVGTGKVSIIGVFTNFTVRQFPGVTSPFRVFVQLTDGVGRYEIVVEVHDLRDDTILARAAGLGIEYPERLRRLNLMIPVPPLPLAHGGTYDLVVLANGEEIDRQQFTATTPGGPSNDDDESAESEEH